jgi:hypothetical protein
MIYMDLQIPSSFHSHIELIQDLGPSGPELSSRGVTTMNDHQQTPSLFHEPSGCRCHSSASLSLLRSIPTTTTDHDGDSRHSFCPTGDSPFGVQGRESVKLSNPRCCSRLLTPTSSTQGLPPEGEGGEAGLWSIIPLNLRLSTLVHFRLILIVTATTRLSEL